MGTRGGRKASEVAVPRQRRTGLGVRMVAVDTARSEQIRDIFWRQNRLILLIICVHVAKKEV